MMNGLRQRGGIKVVFWVLIVALAVGLVASFAIWSVPYTAVPGDSTPSDGSGSANQPQGSQSEEQRLRESVRQLSLALEGQANNKELLVELGNAAYDLSLMLDLTSPEEAQNLRLKAIEAYGQALELDPGNANVRVDRATLAFYDGQYDLAEQDFKRAIEDAPDLVNAHFNYAIFLRDARSDKEGALAQFQAVLDLKPDPTMKANVESLMSQLK